MKYMGSKNRHAKEIIPIILKDRGSKPYIELMVGGANMIDKVKGERFGYDINEYLIALFQELQKGWIPPDYVSEDEHKDVRLNRDRYPPYYVGFVGFCCSYSGKWFGGFARNVSRANPDHENLNKTSRNYCAESKRNLLKQLPNILDVIFECKSYLDVEINETSIIYLDPPYQGTTKYKDAFDHDAFWDFCRQKSLQVHDVFISEYTAPDDFECVWSKEVNNSLTKNTGAKKGVEKLFIYNPYYKLFSEPLDF